MQLPFFFSFAAVLKEFLCEAKQLKLPLRSRDDDDSNDGDFDAASVSSPIDRFGMTEKKAHEVKRMAAQISSIVNQVGIHQVWFDLCTDAFKKVTSSTSS